MTTRSTTVFGATLAVTLTVLGLADMAAASCNAIPERSISFAGFRGAVDRPFVRAAAGDFLKIKIGPKHGSPALTDINDDGKVDERDLNVTIVFKPTGRDSHHEVFIAGDGNCDAGPECIDAKEAQLSAVASDGEAELRFLFPDTDFAGPLTVAVTPVSQPLPFDLEESRCAESQHSNLIACIDELYPGDAGSRSALASNDASGDTPPPHPSPPANPGPPSQQLMALPPPNDFQALCTEDVGDKPRCKGGGGVVLRFTVGDDGVVLIPMKWTNILRPKDGGLDRRQVRGSSAVDAFLNGNSPIFIPSAAFLETQTVVGTGFNVEPLFVPDPLPNRPNEVTLFGTSDKDDSVLRILPRRLWERQCSGGVNNGQACEPYPQYNTTKQDCPGGTCAVRPTPSYFACVGGTRDKLPCTRPHHCPGGGTCSPGSQCYTHSGGATGKPCQTEAQCDQDQDCGLGLFEFRDRAKNGIVEIPRHAGGGYSGVCDSGNKEGDKCTGSWRCGGLLPIFGPQCAAYRAEAILYKPVP